MKETLITIIRHGETEWNKIGKQQGHLDSKLTLLGIKQAKLIAKFFKKNAYDIIYSSDLGRAIQTAKIVNKKLKVELISEKNLRERNLGIMQGLTMNEFINKYPDEYQKFKTDTNYVIPGGESAIQRYNRTINAINEIIKNNKGKKILIITHGGNLDSIFRKTFNISLSNERNFSLLNSSINTFIVNNDNWKLITWGNVFHLKNIKALDDF